jgi:hypothetical protein
MQGPQGSHFVAIPERGVPSAAASPKALIAEPNPACPCAMRTTGHSRPKLYK